MRRSMSDKGVITSEIVEVADGRKTGGQVIGINLGWDFCAEHEWGVKDLNRAFGIPGKPERRSGVHGLVSGDLVGADTRTVTKVPKDLKFFENIDGYAYLFFSSSISWIVERESDLTAEGLAKRFDDALESSRDEDLSTAWSGNSFGIRMKNDALNLGTMVLGQIYEAFASRDAMIFFSGKGNPFANKGLVLAIRSRVPEEILNQMREAVEKTGIEEKLKANDKRYFALSPRWASSIKSTSDGEVKTTHPVIFWLNPMKQDQNNFGWFTVEQLTEWIDGKGPIPKTRSTTGATA